jgi:hypothetical protein
VLSGEQLLRELGTLLVPLNALVLKCNNLLLEVSNGLSLVLKVEGEDIPHHCGVHQHDLEHTLSGKMEHLHVVHRLQEPQKLAHNNRWRVYHEQHVGERETLSPSRVEWVHGREQTQRSEHHHVWVLLAESVKDLHGRGLN